MTWRARKSRKNRGLISRLLGGAVAVAASAVAFRSLPDLLRYLRMSRMAGPKTPAPRETAETIRSAAQAPRRAESETHTVQ